MPVAHEEEVRGAGRRRILYGHILTMDTGVKVYLARRNWRQVFRGGMGSISGAMSEEVASWAIDEALIYSLRAKGVRFVGVRVEDTGDIYLTRMETFFDRKCFKVHDYSGVGRGGSRQRYVKLTHFAQIKGTVLLDEAEIV